MNEYTFPASPSAAFPEAWLHYCAPSLGTAVAAAEANVAALAQDGATVYPAPALRYRALAMPPAAVRVVILGQDPYHGEDMCNGVMQPQAVGLSFSVPAGMRPPPSLRNMGKELLADTGETLGSGDLSHWAAQGVLLLNTGLTVTRDQPASHKKVGWHQVTDLIIGALGRDDVPRVFILWGAHAQAKAELIAAHHAVISSAHPSPLSASRGFFGSRPFSRANAFLQLQGQPPLVWGSPFALGA